jgi:hypothetical protein
MAQWSEEDEQLFRDVGGEQMQFGFDGETEWNFGWFPVNPLVDPAYKPGATKLFSAEAQALLGSGEGKTVLLYEAARAVMGRDLDAGPQAIGDCVGWAFAGGVDLLACVEIVAGEAESYDWEGRASTEVIYALSRREYGSANRWIDGSSSSWAATAVRKGGTLSRARVGAYDPQRAREWGRTGLPNDLEEEAEEHRVAKTALVGNFAEARDALANGYPVAVGSNVGFATERDAEGFCGRKGKWNHCMKFVAVKDDERPALLCMNSPGRPQSHRAAGRIRHPAGIVLGRCRNLQRDAQAEGRLCTGRLLWLPVAGRELRSLRTLIPECAHTRTLACSFRFPVPRRVF